MTGLRSEDEIIINMYRFLFRFSVTVVTILTANLITNAISGYLVSFRNHYDPVKFTIIGMAVIVVIFYPLFIKLEDWVKSVSAKVMRSGNSFAGKYIGLPVIFVLTLLILFHFYAKMWYGISLLQILLYKVKSFLSGIF